MKTTEEKIKVMQHYENGWEVECICVAIEGDKWEIVTAPIWDWDHWDYRIKEEKIKPDPYVGKIAISKNDTRQGLIEKHEQNHYTHYTHYTVLNYTCISIDSMRENWYIQGEDF